MCCFVSPVFVHSSERGAGCSSVVRAFAHGAMVRRINPSWGGPIELFLVPASAGMFIFNNDVSVINIHPWYVLSCLWDGAYKRTLAVKQKE